MNIWVGLLLLTAMSFDDTAPIGDDVDQKIQIEQPYDENATVQISSGAATYEVDIETQGSGSHEIWIATDGIPIDTDAMNMEIDGSFTDDWRTETALDQRWVVVETEAGQTEIWMYPPGGGIVDTIEVNPILVVFLLLFVSIGIFVAVQFRS